MNSLFNISKINDWTNDMTSELVLVTHELKTFKEDDSKCKLLHKEIVELKKITNALQKIISIKIKLTDDNNEPDKKPNFRSRS